MGCEAGSRFPVTVGFALRPGDRCAGGALWSGGRRIGGVCPPLHLLFLLLFLALLQLLPLLLFTGLALLVLLGTLLLLCLLLACLRRLIQHLLLLRLLTQCALAL